ncbi:MAG: GNAT family N-acetyltransferase [Nocardioides sp.]
MTPDDLLQVYDAEVRATYPARIPPGWSVTRDGPLARTVMPREGFAMLVEDASRLTRDELAALVERTFAFYAEQGLGFEWKTFDHDRPDLEPLLVAAGARPDAHEALVLGETRLLAADPVLPDDLTLREVDARADLERIAAMESEVWGEDWSWLADDLEERLAAVHDPVRVFVVEDLASDRVVSAAWLAPLVGTRVAGLWGGSTLTAYRGRGVYRALVAARARLALELGHDLLQVDASDDSRPILERLGLLTVGGTTPYVARSAP